MKKYTVAFAAANEYTHAAPERIARRNAGTGMDFDVTFQVWPNRASMARSIRMQERAATRNPWRAVVALRETEGY